MTCIRILIIVGYCTYIIWINRSYITVSTEYDVKSYEYKVESQTSVKKEDHAKV